MFAKTLPDKGFNQDLLSFEEMLQRSLDSRVNEVSRKFAFDFNAEQPYEGSHQQFVVWQKMPDDRLKVRLPICSLKPKRKISIDSFTDTKSENCSVLDRDDGPNESLGFLAAPTAPSNFDDQENNDSIVSLENANLNTTFNLSSFTSSNGIMNSAVNLASTSKKRPAVETMPEVVKEASRESWSSESLNDRSSQIIDVDDISIHGGFTLKNSKKQLMNRIRPHHCIRESEEELKERQSDQLEEAERQECRSTVKAIFSPHQYRVPLHKTASNDAMPFAMTRMNPLFSRSEVQQLASQEFSDNPFGKYSERASLGSERKKVVMNIVDEDDEDCNFDIDEAEECNTNQTSVCENTIRSTETKLITYTLNKYK